MKIAILGAGTMGTEHANVYANNIGAEVAYVFGHDIEKLKTNAKMLGAKPTADLDEVLGDPSVEAVDVCLPSPVHSDFVIKALDAGKHVFCETPMTLSLKEAEAMHAAAKKNNKLLMVGLLMRSLGYYKYIKQAIDKGELGATLGVYAYRLGSYLRSNGPDHKPHYGNPTTELMTFDYDVMGWLFGAPKSLTARASMFEGQPGHVTATLDYGSFAAQVEASGVMSVSFPFSVGLRVVGEKQVLEITTKFVPDGPPDSTLMCYPAKGEAHVVDIDGGDPYETEILYFLDAVAGKVDPELLSSARAIEALKLSIATQESLKSGEKVTL